MASILPRPGGWQAQVWRRGRPPISRTFKTRADAQAWTWQTESGIARGVYYNEVLVPEVVQEVVVQRAFEQRREHHEAMRRAKAAIEGAPSAEVATTEVRDAKPTHHLVKVHATEAVERYVQQLDSPNSGHDLNGTEAIKRSWTSRAVGNHESDAWSVGNTCLIASVPFKSATVTVGTVCRP